MNNTAVQLLESLLPADQIDERTRVLIQALANQQEEQNKDEEPDPHPSRPRVRLAHRLMKAGVELAELRHRNGVLADALGACEACWGEIPECRRCKGTGRPGAYRPHVELFSELIEPVARMMASGRHEALTETMVETRR